MCAWNFIKRKNRKPLQQTFPQDAFEWNCKIVLKTEIEYLGPILYFILLGFLNDLQVKSARAEKCPIIDATSMFYLSLQIKPD